MSLGQFKITLLILWFLPVDIAFAGTVNVAVASNALSAVKYLANDFSRTYKHKVIISSGSTGKLYSQIVNGAPFDIFFAANEREPMRLEKSHSIVNSTRFTFAYGQLALCSSKKKLKIIADTKQSLSILNNTQYRKIAIANPKIAPYGMASMQVLQKQGLWDKLQNKIIRAENINQAFQYVVSGNVDIGIVALSQVKHFTAKPLYCFVVSDDMHEPLIQQMVILKRAQNNLAAKNFFIYLKSNKVRSILQERFGYGIE